MKRSGEVHSLHPASRDSDVEWQRVKSALAGCVGATLIDHVDIYKDADRKLIFTLSLYGARLTDEIKDGMENYGYTIRYCGYKPYMYMNLIVIQ